MNAIKKYVAECIGTMALVILGCGTAMLVGCSAASGCGYLLTALAFGLTIVGMAYCIGNISGCHINPAVSLGVLLSGGMSVKDFCGYVVAQCIGAHGACFLLNVEGHVLKAYARHMKIELHAAHSADKGLELCAGIIGCDVYSFHEYLPRKLLRQLLQWFGTTCGQTQDGTLSQQQACHFKSHTR